MPLAASQAHSTHLSKTATVDDYDRGEEISVLREKFDAGVRAEDSNRLLVWAGSGVGLMSQIKPAKVCTLHARITRQAMLIKCASPLRKLCKNFMKNVCSTLNALPVFSV